VADAAQRKAACQALNQWLVTAAETATGIITDQIVQSAPATKPATPQMSATDSGPPSLPAGF
jgi:hypothetical protein